jgi:hypothetical protein
LAFADLESKHFLFGMVNRLRNPSSVYYGLRVATTYEVVDLLNSYPLVHPAIPGTFSIGAEIDNSRVFGPACGAMDPVFNQFGWYESSVYPDYSRVLAGYNWDPVAERVMVTSLSESDIYGGVYFPDTDGYELYTATYDIPVMGERAWYGTWLVKPAPVPEPSTLLLLVSGLIGFAWYGWKRMKV